MLTRGREGSTDCKQTRTTLTEQRIWPDICIYLFLFLDRNSKSHIKPFVFFLFSRTHHSWHSHLKTFPSTPVMRTVMWRAGSQWVRVRLDNTRDHCTHTHTQIDESISGFIDTLVLQRSFIDSGKKKHKKTHLPFNNPVFFHLKVVKCNRLLSCYRGSGENHVCSSFMSHRGLFCPR